MVESLRDKTRDELAYNLNSVGVKAEMAERGRAEEKVENSWYQRSLGVIDILEGSIRWMNILKKDGSNDSPPRWWVVLGIPDKRPVSTRQQINIKTVRKKTFPLFGKVVNATWKGYDDDTGLVNTLSEDVPTKTLAKRIGDLEVRSQANGFQGWSLSVGPLWNWPRLSVGRRFSLTSQDWETFERIAGYILSSPRSFWNIRCSRSHAYYRVKSYSTATAVSYPIAKDIYGNWVDIADAQKPQVTFVLSVTRPLLPGSVESRPTILHTVPAIPALH